MMEELCMLIAYDSSGANGNTPAVATTPVPQDVNNPYQYSQNGMPAHAAANNAGPYPSETLPPSGPPPPPHSLMGSVQQQPAGTNAMARPPLAPTSSANHHRSNGSAPAPPPMGHPPHGMVSKKEPLSWNVVFLT